MKKIVFKILFCSLFFLTPFSVHSQLFKKVYTEKEASSVQSVDKKKIYTPKISNDSIGTFKKFGNWLSKNEICNHLDLGVSVGSMGLGLELKTPVTKWVDLRAGVDWFPIINKSIWFNLNTYASGLPTGNFDRVANMVYEMTGIKMDATIKMNGRATMTNFKLMVDFFPVPSNRHWHITAGFYAGTSMAAKAINDYQEKPSLVGLNIYNRAYEYFTNIKDIFNVPLGGGTYMDPDLVEKLQERFEKYGRMGIHIGDFKDGTPYIMEPAPDGTVSARAYVNHFKPYFGAGYSTNLDKAGKWNLGVDLGVIFWGGVPDVINHDYTTGQDVNFSKDLINLKRKVDKYIKVFKAFPVYPGVAIKISYNIL